MSDSTSQPQPSSPAPSSAEASPRYWCHHCGREVSIYMAPDPTCQVCNEQFIEELDADGGDDPRAFLSGGATNDTPSDDDVFNFFGGGAGTTSRRFQFTTEGLDPQEGEGGGDGGGGATMNAMLQSVLSSILSGAAGTGNNNNNNNTSNNDENEDNNTTTDNGNETTGQQQQRRTPMIFYSGMVDGNMQFRPIHLQTNTGDGQQQTEGGDNPTANAFFQFGSGQEGNDNEGETGRGEGRAGLTNNMAAIVQLISAMTGAPMDTAGLVGNPNDYVFSQGALDNIITQLMEQTGGRTAPPPAPEDVIDSLPKRVLSQQEFSDQVDCAVCKDEFNQSEMVIELPCQHLFHDDCIKPWLKMNGTCPVCRHSVLPESAGANVDHGGDNASGQDNNDGSSTNNNQSSPGGASSPNNPSTDSTSSSAAQQNNVNNLASTAFAWFTNNRPSTSTSTSSSSPSSWPANIPGAFTWGPGNSSNNNTSSHTNSQQQQQEDNNNEHLSTEMDLDLD